MRCPRKRGGMAKHNQLPDTENQAERHRHKHEHQTARPQRFRIKGNDPKAGNDADSQRRDDAEDAPDESGFSGDFAPKDDPKADPHHDQIPQERKKQTEWFRAGSEEENGESPKNHEQGAGGERAERQLFHQVTG